MVRQPFERKSLWHLSAPCYHIHISMGDNFETTCTALRTNVLAGACKDEKASFCFQSLPVAFCLSKAPTARGKGCPGSSGHQWPSPLKRYQLGGQGAVSWQGRDVGRYEQDWACWLFSSSLVPCWKSYHHRHSSGRKKEWGLYRPWANWSKFQID